jgi:U4/U6 small nuclear ribonucleoprotein PRP3
MLSQMLSTVPQGADDEADEQRFVVNKCVLVWQGAVEASSFKKFKMETCRTAAAAQRLLADAGVGHFWDILASSEWEGVSEIQ